MLKLLFVFPLLLVSGVLVFAGMLPFLAFLPVLLAVGAGLFAVTLALAVLGLVLRVFAALFVGAGGLLVVALGIGFVFAGGVALLALGFALMHLLLPLLFIVGLIWLIRRASQPAPVLPPPTHA